MAGVREMVGEMKTTAFERQLKKVKKKEKSGTYKD